MTDRRTTPLNKPTIKGHHCTVDLRLSKLGMVPFFQELLDEELRQVHKKFNATHFKSGDTVYYQGDKAAFLRIIVHGSVKLIHQTPDGRDVLLEMLKPGEYFGSLSSLGNTTYSDTAIAQTDVCVLSIGLREFRSVLSNYPDVAVAVLDITAERLASSHDKISRLTTMTAEQRIAGILLDLSDKFGEDSEQGRLIQLPLSRRDLANMAGTTSETASRIMSQFQQEGLINTGRQWIAITNDDKLSTYT